MAKTLPEVKAGWPEEIYRHNGEWTRFQDGYYKAFRNKNRIAERQIVERLTLIHPRAKG